MREASTGLLVTLDRDSNVTDLLLEQHAKDPLHPLYSRKACGGWTDVSARQFLEQVTALAKGLIAGGITPGETVAVMSGTRYEWTVVNFATTTGEAVVAGAAGLPLAAGSPNPTPGTTRMGALKSSLSAATARSGTTGS